MSTYIRPQFTYINNDLLRLCDNIAVVDHSRHRERVANTGPADWFLNKLLYLTFLANITKYGSAKQDRPNKTWLVGVGMEVGWKLPKQNLVSEC